jgi:hypothetical protein
VAHEVNVVHRLSDSRAEQHSLTEGAVIAEGAVVYPCGVQLAFKLEEPPHATRRPQLIAVVNRIRQPGLRGSR